jgi:phosphatidylinositol alpha-1,6-mannosyltransferase
MTSPRPHLLLVTHEYPPYPGGVGRYCASLADAAARAGYRVTVLAPNHGELSEPNAPEHSGVRVCRFPGHVFHFRELRAFMRTVESTLAQQHFDFIHAADWPALMAVGKLAPKQPCIATLHGTDILLMKRSLRARWAGSARALAHFQHFYCNSRYTQGLFETHFPKLSGRSSVTPLGVDAHWFEAPTAQACEAFNQRIGRQPHDQVVLTVARLEGRKGQLTTIAALGALPEAQRKRLRYVCVGKEVQAGYAQQLQQAAAAHDVTLVLTGRIPDDELLAAYATADVFALTGIEQPRSVEGFGLVLLEAAAQGLPAVVTQVQAIPEVVVQGVTGWVAPQAAALPECFAQALSAKASSTGHGALRQQCIDRSRQFTWDRCAEQTYKTYGVLGL